VTISKNQLHLTEWAGLLLLCGLLVAVIAGVTYHRLRSCPPAIDESARPLLSRRMVTVRISGAVQQPGGYQLRDGSKVKDLVQVAGLLPDSDLDSLDLERPLRSREHVRLPVLHWITVYVEGAVAEPGAVTLPEGVTMGDLLKRLTLTEQAQTRNLRRRQLLADQQTVVIPRRRRRPSHSTNS
jgi:protein involved in polysaccharide export with SLBB domain